MNNSSTHHQRPNVKPCLKPCLNVVNENTGHFAGCFPGSARDAVIAAYAQITEVDFDFSQYEARYGNMVKNVGGKVSCGPFVVAQH